MTLRKRGYLTESGSAVWNQYKHDPAAAKIMRSLGFDPNHQPKANKKVCPECGRKEVVIKERHPDTSMNYMERRCLACNYREEE